MLEEKFSKGMAILTETFRVVLSPVAVEGYWIALRGLNDSSWGAAVARALKESKHLPRPSELRDMAQEISSDDRAIVAWSEVRGAISKHGVYQPVDFEDRLINAAVRGMGGWVRLCMLPAEEFAVWGRKEFERQYAVFAKRGLDLGAEMAAPLTGLAEQHNLARGLDAPEVKRIPSTTATLGQAVERKQRLKDSEAITELLALAEGDAS